jgi:ATP-binding cassette subfamily C protein CydC
MEVDRLGDRLAVVRGLGGGLAAGLTSLCAVVVLAVAIPLVTGGQVEAVYLALLPMVAIAAFEGVQPLTTSVQQLDTSRAAGARLFELVDAPLPVVDPPDPAPASSIAAPPAIRIDHLTFAYTSGARPALDDVSLQVPAGGSLAIVGASGSGKTTIVNLLLRFWDYDRGEFRVGDVELRDLRADDVRHRIAVVSQRVDLFDATIRDNLALADPEVTDAQLDEACRIAQLGAVIAALPAGYDTRIGENGVRLSGGERLRLAIARAILRDAPILVLDEASADLDAGTERALVESLRPFTAGRTTLVITHRPALAELAEGTVRMERGRLVG